MKEVEALFAKTPDDPYVFGEKAQLNYDLKMLKLNREYATALAADVEAGKRRFAQGVTLSVPNMDEAVSFWTGGLGAFVLSTRLVNGANVTRVGFGSESLRADDGAKFAVELVEGARSDARSGVEYIQLALPIFRLSQAMKFGAEILSAYGYTELVSPGGHALRVKIDENRRDPFEFVALRTAKMKPAVEFYASLGMSAGAPKAAPKVDLLSKTINSNSLLEETDAFEPPREIGSVLMSYDDPDLSTGYLLLPPTSRKPLPPPDTSTRLRVVGAPPLPDPTFEGLASEFIEPAAFETSVRR